MTAGADGPDIRVGHAERDQAVDVLRDAAAEGRLTLEELDERIGRALGARTRSQLLEVLADLVPRGPLEQMLSPHRTPQLRGPGQSWEDPLVISATWEGEKRLGPWDVPPFLEIKPSVSDIKLNCVDARPQADLIDVVVLGSAGTLIVVVPAGWAADVGRLDKGLGSIKSYVPTTPEPGFPLLVFRGKTGMGDVKVRYPNRYDDWQLQRDREKRRPPQLGR